MLKTFHIKTQKNIKRKGNIVTDRDKNRKTNSKTTFIISY